MSAGMVLSRRTGTTQIWCHQWVQGILLIFLLWLRGMMCVATHVNRTGSASQRLFLIYVATHGWLRGFVAKLAYLDIACSGHGERDWAQADLSEKTD